MNIDDLCIALDAQEICLHSVERFLTEEIVLEVVKRVPECVQCLPKHLRSKKIYLAAVKEEGICLAVVPSKYKTSEIIREALKNTPWALQYVPRRKMNKAMVMDALSRTGNTMVKGVISPEMAFDLDLTEIPRRPVY